MYLLLIAQVRSFKVARLVRRAACCAFVGLASACVSVDRPDPKRVGRAAAEKQKHMVVPLEEQREPATGSAPPTPVRELEPDHGIQTDTRRGSLSKEVVRHGISKEITAVRLCMEPALRRSPGARGPQVTMRFVIGASGNVQAASVTQSKVDSEADSCLLEAFKRMRFPSPKGGGIVEVTYPVWVDAAGG